MENLNKSNLIFDQLPNSNKNKEIEELELIEKFFDRFDRKSEEISDPIYFDNDY